MIETRTGPTIDSTDIRVDPRPCRPYPRIRRRAVHCVARHMLVFLCAITPAAFAGTASDSFNEYEIKAAYLYNFSKLVEWPPEAFADAAAPLSIAIVGQDPFGSVLDEGLNGKTINNRKLVVRRLKWPADLRAYHIVFIGASEKKQLPQIIQSLHGAPVLTVTETDLLARSQCVINFVIEANKVRFELDIGIAEQARLKISSKLLLVARVFKDGSPLRKD